ncbi:MAG TPA: FecR domain-containing protein [Sphingopyxis sp.]|nr:FecR domain-containing protein [Sphingopyxis sp.]
MKCLASAGPINAIDEQAAVWAVETAHGEMNAQSRADLEAWLSADTRHRGAYIRACAWLRAAEHVATAAHRAPAASVPIVPLRTSDNDNDGDNEGIAPGALRMLASRWSGRAVAGGAAVAMSLALLVAVGVPVPGLVTPTETSASAKIVTLKDGSVATLGRDAQIQVSLSEGIRKITLLRGEATFEVAKDKSRPFVVRSGDVYAQATGTVYSVRRVGLTGGGVRVSEGSVLVWPRDERDQAVLLHAGGTVTLDPGPLATTAQAPRPASRRLPPPELAQISLDNVPVRAAVARFNRVNSTKIILADPAIGDIEIIGLYRANDPEHFAEAVAAISGAHIERSGSTIVIKMK